MKNTKYHVLMFILLILIITNVYYYIQFNNLKLMYTSDCIKSHLYFYGNNISSLAICNANYSNREGYFVNKLDTVQLNHYLHIQLFDDSIYDSKPKSYFYEFIDSDSSILLLDSLYCNDIEDFQYIIKDTASKLFLFETYYPFEDSILSFRSVLPIRVKDAHGRLSQHFSNEKIDYLLDISIK